MYGPTLCGSVWVDPQPASPPGPAPTHRFAGAARTNGEPPQPREPGSSRRGPRCPRLLVTHLPILPGTCSLHLARALATGLSWAVPWPPGLLPWLWGNQVSGPPGAFKAPQPEPGPWLSRVFGSERRWLAARLPSASIPRPSNRLARAPFARPWLTCCWAGKKRFPRPNPCRIQQRPSGHQQLPPGPRWCPPFIRRPLALTVGAGSSPTWAPNVFPGLRVAPAEYPHARLGAWAVAPVVDWGAAETLNVGGAVASTSARSISSGGCET
jgi:hypothetical protein